MTSLEKAGYILLGVSGGIFISTMLYEREIRRGIDKDEPYTPPKSEEKENGEYIISNDIVENGNDFQTKHITAIEDLKERANKRREEFELNRSESSNLKTDYRSKYQNAGRDMVNDILNHIPAEVGSKEAEDMEAAYLEYIEESDEDETVDDIPPEDEPSEDSEYILERVEEWIEVYLGDNPQEFVSLVYYEGDDTLCDDREQLISNPEDVVGTVALERLVTGGAGAEEGIIFVRNLKTMLNYEVVLDAGSYSETVLGIFEGKLGKGDGGDVDNR